MARIFCAVAALVLTIFVVVAAWLTAPAAELVYSTVVPHTAEAPMIGVLADSAILGLLAGYGAVLWRSRRSVQFLAPGLAAGVGVVVGYAASESVKLLVGEERPCRAVISLAECPAVGDWSFPSNHMTIASGLAVAMYIIARRSYRLSAVLVVAVAVGRVGQGAHYPHDVLAGISVGLGLVAVTVLAGAPAIAGMVHKMDARRALLAGGLRAKDNSPR
jgi:membrane-associated phospholipid phosphatase